MRRTPSAVIALPLPSRLPLRLPLLQLPLVMVLGLSSLAAGSFGCAMTGPTVRLAPVTSEVTWANGTALVQRAGISVRVVAGFEHQDGDALSVQVAIENQGTSAFEVDPRWIAFTPCRTAEIESCMPARWAHDPEHVLASLDARSSQEAVEASNAQAALAVLAIFSAVVDIASIAKGHRHRGGLGTLAAVGAHDRVAIQHQRTEQALQARRQNLAATCLRRTTVMSGQSIAGRVLLPIDLRARYVWLHIRAGGEKFTIPFHQTVTPDPETMANSSAAERTDRPSRPLDRRAGAGFLH